jgi:hypothetical protein
VLISHKASLNHAKEIDNFDELIFLVMTKEKSIKEKSNKKAPVKNLKEKRIAKEARREDKKRN